MTEVENLLLQGMKDLRTELQAFGKEIRDEVGHIKVTQGRMDERLQTLERPDTTASDVECLKNRVKSLESTTDVVKSGGRGKAATAITISLAGVGAVVWSIVKAVSGAP